LCEALKTKRVAAAAFDVFEEEPVKPDNPLLALDNFICTPHIGAQTTEAQENVAVGIAEQIVDYFTRGVAKGAVNIPSVSPELLPRLQPFLTLAEKLGSLQMQLSQGGIERVTVEYSGEVASLSVAPLTIAVLKGLLNPIMEHPVNYVNAPIVAKERGIEVKEIKSSDAGDFISLIRVRVEAGKVSHQVAGTLYHKKESRVVEIDQFKVEMVPEGHLLFIHNMDRPGVIGMVGKVLGDKGINIVRMQCALEKRGGDALLIIGSDTEFPADIVGQIKSSSNILSVKVASLS
jgi:D-3-phosphoglycerate dehydrogenase